MDVSDDRRETDVSSLKKGAQSPASRRQEARFSKEGVAWCTLLSGS
jgi:hypothetical protein